MTREEAIGKLTYARQNADEELDPDWCASLDMAIKALEQTEPEKCGDCISREQAIKQCGFGMTSLLIADNLRRLPSVEPERKTGYCKECKYFEYNSVAKVDEIPLIVAHEICKRWGDGCKTSEDGYCFLYEPQESEDNEDTPYEVF